MYMLTIERSYILLLYVSVEISVLGGLLIIKQDDFTINDALDSPNPFENYNK